MIYIIKLGISIKSCQTGIRKFQLQLRELSLKLHNLDIQERIMLYLIKSIVCHFERSRKKNENTKYSKVNHVSFGN